MKRHPLGASIGARAGTGAGYEDGFVSGEVLASKDIAESPTALAGTPKKMSTDNSQQTKDFVLIGIVRYVSMCIFYRNH